MANQPPHPTTVVLPEPIRVSSLIRFARWSALGLGIVYGYVRYYQISANHAKIRESEAQKFIHHKEEELHNSAMKTREEAEFILGIVGTPLEEGKQSMDVAHLYPYRKE